MPQIRATYRLQLHAGFPLSRVRALVPYLSRLGISHLHCSPMLQARRGSTHGYDVVDPNALDPELGTEAELEALHRELREHGMGIVLDIVPNHMAASEENPAWEDVLAHGPASRFARWFDIDWRASERELRSHVLLPVLGDARVRALARGEIALALEDGVPRVRYFEHGFPLDPSTMPPVLASGLAGCDKVLGRQHLACETLREIIGTLRALPRRLTTDSHAISRRLEDSAIALDRLRTLVAAYPQLGDELAQATAVYARGPQGPVRLQRLLDAQVYRLVYWRRAAREINYRRFFDVNDLVALHMEDPEVFAQTHALVLEWRRRGWVDGFRIDHPDGLLDPRGYFERLDSTAFPDRAGPPPVWVEKILAQGERLRRDWPVAGTTGYDFLNEAQALFVSPAGYEALEREYRRVIRQPLDFTTTARQGKRMVLESALSAGVRRLAERLLKLPRAGQPLREIPIPALARAITETIVSLPVYRTYVDERLPVPAGEDRRLLQDALAEARGRGRARADALDLLEAALLPAGGPPVDPAAEGLRLRFVQRFQQLSGPAAAKGVEDTAFYVYTPLLSRNEVGGGPEVPLASAVERFHAGNAHRAAHFPSGMLAVTTHDTKRNADLRSRLDVLSEIPAEWAERLDHWRTLNLPFKTLVRGGRRLPDPNTVQHLFQALLGIWPLSPFGVGDLSELRERLSAYALKAAREAKQHTSWTEPDAEFENALHADVEAILSPERAPRLLDDVERVARRIALPGLWNALSRTVLHLASPGVPDIYQGDELWSFALVDPDNRRPVDYDERMRKLEEVEGGVESGGTSQAAFLQELVRTVADGRLKLHVIRAALAARRHRPEPFRSTAYEPLEAAGSEAGKVVAFARGNASARLIAAVPRLIATSLLEQDGNRLPTDPALWGTTTLALPPDAPRRWTCALSGESHAAGVDGRLRLDRLFGILPVALLLSDPSF